VMCISNSCYLPDFLFPPDYWLVINQKHLIPGQTVDAVF
jgi:hypothetical protein